MRTKIGSVLWLGLLAAAAAQVHAQSSVVVESAGGQLTLSAPYVERYEDSFAIVRWTLQLVQEGNTRRGSLTARAVPQSVPSRAAAVLFGAKMLDFRLEGLPDFLTKQLREAVAARLASGIEVDQEMLMGAGRPPGPLFPAAARGLLRVWPRIEVRNRPAILVYVDGDPIMATVPGTKLQYVVNTDWDLFFHQDAYNHYLRAGRDWYESYSVQGPWIPLRGDLPEDFASIPASHPRAHVRTLLPKKGAGSSSAASGLEVVVAQEPTELVVFDGEPRKVPIPGTDLSYAENTASDVFFAQDGVALVASGRWFGARSLAGPWVALGERLPEGLARIPADHAKAHVRALVPGTPESKVALAQAGTAVFAAVRRDLQLEVRLLGPPQVISIQGELGYVKNTTEDMLVVGDQDYCCRNGVWFAANEPVGPWAVACRLPPQLQQLPPSSPLYHLRSAQVLAYTPTTVTFGYTSGYTGAFVDGATLVYGTGFSEPGFVQAGVYYGFPPLLGLGRRFDPVRLLFIEQPPVTSPFAGTDKDVLAPRADQAGGLFPRWGRVGYGLGARELSVQSIRPMEWGPGCVAHGSFAAPLDSGSAADPAALSAAPSKPAPAFFVGLDGQVYRSDAQRWWVREGSDQWSGSKSVPRDVELQEALMRRTAAPAPASP